jgi:hypothetical protein
MFEISNITCTVKSALFCKVCYVLYSGIKKVVYVMEKSPFPGSRFKFSSYRREFRISLLFYSTLLEHFTVFLASHIKNVKTFIKILSLFLFLSDILEFLFPLCFLNTIPRNTCLYFSFPLRFIYNLS